MWSDIWNVSYIERRIHYHAQNYETWPNMPKITKITRHIKIPKIIPSEKKNGFFVKSCLETS